MKLDDDLNNVQIFTNEGYNAIWFLKRHNFHHINGPSWIRSEGHEEYCINGSRHNTKGPSYIFADGVKCYYLDGKYLSEKEWQNEVGRQSEYRTSR